MNRDYHYAGLADTQNQCYVISGKWCIVTFTPIMCDVFLSYVVWSHTMNDTVGKAIGYIINPVAIC